MLSTQSSAAATPSSALAANVQTLLRLLLGMALLLTTLRLFGFMVRFADKSLQMDFAAFYTAGEARNAGLSPYLTHLDHSPPIWDGINEFMTSRFLYPPLVASAFQPLARLDYATAKTLWMIGGLLCLLASLWLVNRRFRLDRQPTLLLAFGVLVTSYYPLLTYLERGQIDALNLLLLTGALLALLQKYPRRQLWAGLLIAAATLLKLQCLYFVPFLLWRRQWWAVVGYGVGGALLAALSLWLNGPTALIDYVRVEVPRIGQYGDLGAPEQFMAREAWQALHADLPAGYTTKGGAVYEPEAFFFTKNATTVRNLHSILRRAIPTISQTVVSLLALGGFFGLLLLWERYWAAPAATWTARQRFFYWQLVLLIILLAGPMTWIMNLIWLLPLTLALFVELQRPLTRRQRRYLAVALLAILVTALPDSYSFPLLLPVNPELLRWQYVFAELLLFGVLLLYWGEPATEG